MKYRLLEPQEWDRITPLFERCGQKPPPHPGTGLPIMAAVAEDDSGEIRGTLLFQPVFHVEPLILEDRHASFKRLFETLMEPLEKAKGLGYYVFTDQAVTAGMAEHVGMIPHPVTVWKGEVR